MIFKPLQISDLTIRLPIVQGGMGVGVSLSGLASAVANEGGCGVISCAGLGLIYKNLSRNYNEASILGLKEEIAKARAKTQGVIGVNIMQALSNFSDMVKTAISEKVDIIFVGAGLPMDLPSYIIEGCSTKLVPIISSAKAFKIIAQKWMDKYNYAPDAVVYEGPKAGGHLGFKSEHIFDSEFSLEKVLPEVINEVGAFKAKYNKHVPVIAGGGLYSKEDIIKVLEMGADAVQMGSIFVPTAECDADMAFKQAYLDAQESDITIIKSPVGMPGRALENEFIKEAKLGHKLPSVCSYNCLKSCDYTKVDYCIMKALFFAFKGDLKNGFAFIGANGYKAKKIQSVKSIFAELFQ